MKEWQKQNFDLLVECIKNEFNVLYKRLTKKGKTVYAVTIITDYDGLTAYFMASTLESLKKKHKDSKWVPYCWMIRNDDGDVKLGLNEFVDKHLDYYDEYIVPRFADGNYDYSHDFNDNIEMFTLAMKAAKAKLHEQWGEIVGSTPASRWSGLPSLGGRAWPDTAPGPRRRTGSRRAAPIAEPGRLANGDAGSNTSVRGRDPASAEMAREPASPKNPPIRNNR